MTTPLTGQWQDVRAEDEPLVIEAQIITHESGWVCGSHGGVEDGQSILTPPHR